MGGENKDSPSPSDKESPSRSDKDIPNRKLSVRLTVPEGDGEDAGEGSRTPLGPAGSAVCEDEVARLGNQELFAELLQAISASSQRLREQQMRADKMRDEHIAEVEKAARKPPPPQSGGPFLNALPFGRIFSPVGHLTVPYYEPMKQQAITRPHRCYDRSAVPAFKTADAVPRLFPMEPPVPLPPCKRRPPYPGYPAYEGPRVTPRSQSACAQGRCTSGSGRVEASALANSRPGTSASARQSAMGQKSTTPRSTTPRIGCATAARLKGVQATNMPPPWCPGRATPSDLHPKSISFLEFGAEMRERSRPKTSMM